MGLIYCLSFIMMNEVGRMTGMEGVGVRPLRGDHCIQDGDGKCWVLSVAITLSEVGIERVGWVSILLSL